MNSNQSLALSLFSQIKKKWGRHRHREAITLAHSMGAVTAVLIKMILKKLGDLFSIMRRQRVGRQERMGSQGYDPCQSQSQEGPGEAPQAL